MKKVSVIVPVYKVEKYLDKCMESIVNQTYKNIEIILVDDGSPDECPKMCDEWAKKDDRIRVIHKENGGLSDARNVGMDMSTGEYIGFVDSDDIISIEMYKTLVELLEQSDSDMSACQESRFEDKGSPVFTIDNKVTIVDDNSEALRDIINSELVLSFVWNKLYRQRKNNITNNWNKKNICDFIEANNARYNDLKDNPKVIDSLNIVRLKSIYTSHVGATIIGDKDFYNSKLLIEDYKFLKKRENRKYYKEFIKSKVKKISMLKIVLLINRELFWKIRTRNNGRK